MRGKSVHTLMAKAERALASAQSLVDMGDADGACNRAYYAMFDAAPAALMATDAPAGEGLGKTHRGLLNTFSAHLVKAGRVSKELGRQLKRAEESRWVADYDGSSIPMSDAAELVQQARQFVAAMQKLLVAAGQEPDQPN